MSTSERDYNGVISVPFPPPTDDQQLVSVDWSEAGWVEVTWLIIRDMPTRRSDLEGESVAPQQPWRYLHAARGEPNGAELPAGSGLGGAGRRGQCPRPAPENTKLREELDSQREEIIEIDG
jgi:hypothetical protein